MSLFSVNTNLGAMTALQSLEQTQNALTTTQNQISTGLAVATAADNPAVYSITQAMDGQIAGLTAVQDNLSFGAQVVGTAMSSTESISSVLSTLQQTLTQGQTQGMSQTQMNASLTAGLQQIDSFANGASLNGVNLIAGATGNGVTNTQLSVLTSTQGDSFAVGGTGAQALNATSAGLGIAALSVTSTDTQVALGADSATAGKGLTLIASGAALQGAAGQAASSTNFVVQTSNYATGGTAQNVAAQTTVVLNDGSTNGTNDILNQINAAVAAATGTTGAASYANGSPLALSSKTGLTGTTFTLAAGSPTLSTSSTGTTVVDVPSTNAEAVGQFTQYTLGAGSTLSKSTNTDGSTTYSITDAGTGTGQVSTAQTFLGSNATDGSATDISSLSNGISITLSSSAPALTVPSTGNTTTFSLASTTNPGDTTLYSIGAGANITKQVNSDGTTTYNITDAVAGDSKTQNYKPATAAGSDFTLNSDGSIGVTAGSANASISSLGNGSTEYTVVTARDGNGNATSEVNIISANVSQLAVPGTSSNLADALNGASANNSSGAVATRTAALGVAVSALNGAGFNATIDANNNLTVAGNNINTIGAAGNTTATTVVNNFTGAAGTGIGGIQTTTTTTTSGTASLLLGNDTAATTGTDADSTTVAGQLLVADGNTLDANGTGALANNTNVVLTTSNFGNATAESAQNVGAITEVMLSDGSGFGSAVSSTTTNAQNDVLNALNNLVYTATGGPSNTNATKGVADYGATPTTGSAFTVNSSGQIQAVTGGGGKVTTLSDGSTEYSYALKSDANGNVTQEANLIVASVAGLGGLTGGVATNTTAAGFGSLATALDGTGGASTAYNAATRNAAAIAAGTLTTAAANSATNVSIRQQALGILANAVTAGGFNANLNVVSGSLNISGTNLSTAAVNNFTAATTSSTGNATAVISATDTAAAGTYLQMAATGSTLATTATGQAATNTNLALQTNNFGISGLESASNVGQQTVVMMNDGSTSGTTNTLNDVLNQLNSMVSNATNNAVTGVADYASGKGSVFNLTNGQITTASGQTAGSISQLVNSSGQNVGTEYSFVTKTDSSGNATEKVNVILASALSGAQVTALSTAADDTGLTGRASALATLTNATNAAGFSATLTGAPPANVITVTGQNLESANLNGVLVGGTSTPQTGITTFANGPTTNLGANAITSTTTSTKTGSAGVYGVQQSDATAAIANITAAITKLGTISSQLGTASDHITGMQSFTSSLSSALTAGVGALTDADMATESAKLTSLQTKQQLGIQALSIANQQPQVLLKLFGG